VVKVSVLALQGDYLEHYQLLKGLERVEPLLVKHGRELGSIDALIVPGGESTTIGALVKSRGLDEPLREFARMENPC